MHFFSPLPHSGSCTWTRWCSTDCSVTQRDQRPVQSSCIIHRMQSENVNCGLQSKVSVHLWSARLCWNAPPQLQRTAELNVALLKVDKQKVPCLRGLKRSIRLIGGRRGSLWFTGTFHSRYFQRRKSSHLACRAPLDEGDVTGLGFVFCDPPIFIY